MSNKRKSFCVDAKVSLIRAIERGETKSAAGRRFGLSPSTVSSIWKSKEKILQAEREGRSSKRLRKPRFKDLDREILLWYKNLSENDTISGPVVKAKAEEVAKQMGVTDFKASEGWLGKFKQRHNITFGRQNEDTMDNWIDKTWPKLKDKYAPSDIFNVEEAGLLLKPDETLEGEKGGVEIILAVNINNTEERQLIVVAEIENEPDWMASQRFKEEVHKWDAELKGRKILLLLDSSPTHPVLSNLQSIKLAFVPSSTSSILQPMDPSVIDRRKGQLRRKLLMGLIESDGSVKSTPNMLQPTPHTECDSHTVKMEQFDGDENLSLSDCIQDDNTPQNINKDIKTYEDMQDTTTTIHTEEDIVDPLADTNEIKDDDDQVDLEPTVQQALDAVKLLEKFFLFNQDEDETTTFQDIDKIHEKILTKHRQSRQSN